MLEVSQIANIFKEPKNIISKFATTKELRLWFTERRLQGFSRG